jgi:hypothetical protein
MIDCDADTVLSTQGSVDLALEARDNLLRLYPDADDCGMRHYRPWLELQPWLRDQLTTVRAPV